MHARLGWVHPIDYELEWALHDLVYIVEQWVRDISETVTGLPHQKGTLVELVVWLATQF